MLELYETFTNTQKNTFADICNKLLANTYLARDKRDNKEAYYFIVSYKDLFEEYFKLMNMQLVLNRDLGTVTLENANTQTILKLKRDESIVLLIIRLLYHEKLKETSINTNVVASINDLHAKYDMLEIKRKINKTDLISMLRLFRKYNLIEPMGDINNPSTQFIIFPTILEALKTEQIDAVYNTINRIAAEGGNN